MFHVADAGLENRGTLTLLQYFFAYSSLHGGAKLAERRSDGT